MIRGREFSHIRQSPMPGDVVEFREGDDEVMLRVLAVLEDHVWFKEYGCANCRRTMSIKAWQHRLEQASVAKVIRPGDYDLPF